MHGTKTVKYWCAVDGKSMGNSGQGDGNNNTVEALTQQRGSTEKKKLESNGAPSGVHTIGSRRGD